MSTDTEIDDLILSLYDASTDSSALPVAIEKLTACLSATTGHFFVFRPDTRAGIGLLRSHMVGNNEEGAKEYFEVHAATDPRRLRTEGLKNGVFSDKDILSADEMGTLPLFTDFLKRYDLKWNLGLRLTDAAGAQVNVSVLRPERRGHFSEAEIAIFRRLQPHVARMVAIQARLGDSIARMDAFDAFHERLDVGVVVLGDDRRVRFVNRVAESLIGRGRGLACRNGRISATEPGIDAVLQRRIGSAVAARGSVDGGCGGVVRIEARETELRLVVLVAPLRAERFRTGSGVLLVINAPERSRRPGQRTLMDLYGLTAAEARLAGRLLADLSLKEISERDGSALSTLRTQLAAIFRKTDTRRQSELILRVLSDTAGLGIGREG